MQQTTQDDLFFIHGKVLANAVPEDRMTNSRHEPASGTGLLYTGSIYNTNSRHEPARWDGAALYWEYLQHKQQAGGTGLLYTGSIYNTNSRQVGRGCFILGVFTTQTAGRWDGAALYWEYLQHKQQAGGTGLLYTGSIYNTNSRQVGRGCFILGVFTTQTAGRWDGAALYWEYLQHKQQAGGTGLLYTGSIYNTNSRHKHQAGGTGLLYTGSIYDTNSGKDWDTSVHHVLVIVGCFKYFKRETSSPPIINNVATGSGALPHTKISCSFHCHIQKYHVVFIATYKNIMYFSMTFCCCLGQSIEKNKKVINSWGAIFGPGRP